MAIDWDGTLVDSDGEWQPGAVNALRWLQRHGHKVIIHSSRASWEGGQLQIQEKLAGAWLLGWGEVQIAAKPEADIYIDDRAVTYTDWATMIARMRSRK